MDILIPNVVFEFIDKWQLICWVHNAFVMNFLKIYIFEQKTSVCDLTIMHLKLKPQAQYIHMI